MTPAVSIIIATRNRRHFLEEAIDSVLAQRGESFEILVVDDGSTDDTLAYLAAVGRDIRTFRHPAQMGQSASVKTALPMARGSLVMFLDDDDRLWPNALKTLVSALRKEPAAIAAVGARWEWFTQEGYKRRDAHPRLLRTRVVFDELLFGWSAPSGQSLYRTSVVRAAGAFGLGVSRCQDRDLWLRIARQGPVVLCPEIVMTYRWHSGQTRLANIRDVREQVARRAIRGLPRDRRRRALRIRRSTRWFDAAQDAISEGRYLGGVTAAASAVAASPMLFTSPLIWPLFVRRLTGRLWHRLRGR
jgi:glycosyltransferase involved in cell wall biosynthesis